MLRVEGIQKIPMQLPRQQQQNQKKKAEPPVSGSFKEFLNRSINKSR